MHSPESPAITAILLSWRRPANLPVIVERLRKSRLFREVLVWNNNPEITLACEGAVVINAGRNFFPFVRYCLVALASHPLIWFQDDDLLVSPDQLEKIFAAYELAPDRIYGCRGRNLVDGRYSRDVVHGNCDVILGQSMLFHKRLLNSVLPALNALAPMERGDDIAFSLLCRRKHFAVDVGPVADLGEGDEDALWLQPGHFSRRQQMVDRVLGTFSLPVQPPQRAVQA